MYLNAWIFWAPLYFLNFLRTTMHFWPCNAYCVFMTGNKTPERDIFFGKWWEDFFSSECVHRSLSPSKSNCRCSVIIWNHLYAPVLTENCPKNHRSYCINTEYQGYMAYLTVQQQTEIFFFHVFFTIFPRSDTHHLQND